MAFDNQLNIIPQSRGGFSDCQVGGSFKVNHVGLLSQVKYFLGEVGDKGSFVDQTRFQGSADN